MPWSNGWAAVETPNERWDEAWNRSSDLILMREAEEEESGFKLQERIERNIF